MTKEGNISWSKLLENPIVTAQHGNDGNRIATATESLKETAHQFAQFLSERAKLLANSAQFERALRDVAAIRAILPGSGLGYLCMGDVYCQQGHHSAAISIYDQGLETVPESDPYYQQLQQHRMAAVANNDKRIDFISQLPLDIVITHIVPRMEQPACLDSEVLYEPLYVSRTWQERILQQSNGLAFDFGKETTTFKRGHAQLVRFAPYVETLSVCLLENVHLDDLFSRAHFSNLKELDIFCVPMILWIVLNAPSLNAIHTYIIHFRPDVAKAMTKLKHLRKVHIEKDHSVIMLNYDGIRQFFEYHVSMGEHSTLEHVVVDMNFVDPSQEEWLPLLLRLKSLKIFELHADDIAEECHPIFGRLLQDCPTIEEYIVTGDHYVI
ncbi:hypothetical protein O0I10_011661 [Lichtheimia ornata]|uniref:Uncharacterized protein n=1 Tax=Lichtheimia ornata TaxID=688661 RepID=A0AAD7XTX4_9FUNG|nr:uncharacterized protein O0I10_011661 [Lichtheimia ornata]KAJ8652716.1 hypothetical protein O0I10_011661 [Lichtheimia ornata]